MFTLESTEFSGGTIVGKIGIPKHIQDLLSRLAGPEHQNIIYMGNYYTRIMQYSIRGGPPIIGPWQYMGKRKGKKGVYYTIW